MFSLYGMKLLHLNEEFLSEDLLYKVYIKVLGILLYKDVGDFVLFEENHI